MKFFFYIPGMPADGHVMENLSLGGSESAGMYMAREMVRRGHRVVAFTNGQPGEWDGVEIAAIGQPSEQFPAGENFDRRATTEPHDVLIAQRTSAPFLRPKNCRQSYMSMHDLARVRSRSQIKGSMWNCDGILAVSDWHKNQIEQVYDMPENYVHTIRNGIDLSLYSKEPDYERKFKGKKIIYQSRPERGLINLVGPGGIMEKLAGIDPEITLVVCGYDNTTAEMEQHYRNLWGRCHELPNVELVGSLNKRTLAELLYDAALLVYPVVPVVEHEETSCISIMEAQAAGTPVITMANGAIIETAHFAKQTDPGPVTLFVYQDDGNIKLDQYADAIVGQLSDFEQWGKFAKNAFERAPAYTWEKPAEALEELVGSASREQTSNELRLAKHFAYNSDRAALVKLRQQDCTYPIVHDFMVGTEYVAADKIDQFYVDENIRAIDKGNVPGPEDIEQIPTTRMVLQVLDRVALRGPFKLLDYGCRVGALLRLLAKRYPECTFTGADISSDAIAEASKNSKADGLANLDFVITVSPEEFDGNQYDVVLCMETLEHVVDPAGMADALEHLLKPLGTMCMTFPVGPSEASSHLDDVEPYEHINHLEWQDVQDMWAHKESFTQNFFAWGAKAPNGASIGGQVVTWQRDGELDGSKPVDWNRKMVEQAPRETLTVCMIVKEGSPALEKTIKSLVNVADEIVVGVDGDVHGMTDSFALCNWSSPKVFNLSASPLEQGFDAARNETLEKATCDWILWIDSDEELVYPERLLKYLRPNCYEAYAISHHHLTAEPAGLLKTDYPTRLFRRKNGWSFHGMVHEHPSLTSDTIPKHVMVLGENISIVHSGYLNEEVRRKRFERNWPLMQKDREKYPERVLGEFLFLRDLLHVAKFELEHNQGKITDQIRGYAEQGLAIFDRLIEMGELRFVLESLPYVGEAARILKGSNVMTMQLAVGTRHFIADQSLKQIVPEKLEGIFADIETAKKVSNMLINDQFKPYEEKYL